MEYCSSLLAKKAKEFFGHSSFKENQLEAIKAILNGRDLFLNMATGMGKSLCYQLPALMMEGLCVVISPLIALMKDQVDKATLKNLPALYLNSSLSIEEKKSIYHKIYKGEVKILYLSPELILEEGFVEFFKHMTKGGISFFAIDEAHCITLWGSTFRKAYSQLYKLKDFFPAATVAAFTATSTIYEQQQIIKTLKLNNPLVIRSDLRRSDLSYKVILRKNRLTQIDAILKNHKKEQGIIYLLKKEEAEKLSLALSKKGYSTATYHSDLTIKERQKNQDNFLQGKVQIICATIGFGMGIDKEDIRFIIHTFMPASLEDFYQQTGRASRDKKGAVCYLLFNPKDLLIWKKIIESTPTTSDGDLELKQKAYQKVLSVFDFCNATSCREKILLSYFDQKESSENCGRCDICLEETSIIEGINHAKSFLYAIYATQNRFGKNYIIDLLLGESTNPNVKKYEHHKLEFFGAYKNYSRNFFLYLYEKLLQEQLIVSTLKNGYPILELTPSAYKLLEEKNPRSKNFIFPIPLYLSQPKSSTSKKSSKIKTSKTEKLLKELTTLREKIAKANSCEAIFILSQKALVQIASYLPTTKKEFLDIEGVTPFFIENFLPHFIRITSKYKK